MAERKSAGVAAAGPAVKKVHSHARGMFKRAQTMVGLRTKTAEADRLREDESREKNWKRWGPYLSERQWATVREDYSPDGSWYVSLARVWKWHMCTDNCKGVHCMCCNSINIDSSEV